MNDSQSPTTTVPTQAGGSRDGNGAGDHDEPFGGWRSYHFSTAQMLHLLLLRGEILDGRLGAGRFAEDLVNR
jgi:hypothetical protein